MVCLEYSSSLQCKGQRLNYCRSTASSSYYSTPASVQIFAFLQSIGVDGSKERMTERIGMYVLHGTDVHDIVIVFFLFSFRLCALCILILTECIVAGDFLDHVEGWAPRISIGHAFDGRIA